MFCKIRGASFICFQDGTDASDLILSITPSPEDRSVVIEADRKNITQLVRKIQSGSVIYVQCAEGLYLIKYLCSFKGIDAANYPTDRPYITLSLSDFSLYRGEDITAFTIN